MGLLWAKSSVGRGGVVDGGSWKRSHRHGYTGTKGETPDTAKPGPDGPPRQFPTLHNIRAVRAL